MKLLFASDIHGSNFYCKELMAAIEKEAPDKIILLGDILYHGPRNPLPEDYNPQAVSSLLNSISDKIMTVRGNCDSEVDQMLLEFPIMADYSEVFIDGIEFFVTHGHLFNSDNLPKIKGKFVLVHGHTHLKVLEDNGSYVFLNPGSVSIPKDDDLHSYAVYENHKIIIKAMDGTAVKEMSL